MTAVHRIAVDARVVQDRYHGIGRVTAELVRAIHRNRPDAELILFGGTGRATRLSAETLAEEVGARLVPMASPVTALGSQVAWRRLLRRERADVLFVPYQVATPFFAGLPVVVMIHDCIFEESAAFAPSARVRFLYRVMTRLVLARTAGVVVVSEATRAAVARHYGRRLPAESVVRNAVDRRFADIGNQPQPRATTDGGVARERTPLPERYVLSVGVRRPHKNQATLVRAIARLRDLEPPLHLVLVGDGDSRFPDEIPALIDELGVRDRVVELAGVGDDLLPQLYGGAAAFALPSLVEGFGLPILEAMAAGCPVVASDVPAVAEAAGGAARLVPPLDVDAWAAAIRAVVTDPTVSQDLRTRGRAVAAAWTWDDAGRRLLGALDAAAAGAGAAGADAEAGTETVAGSGAGRRA